MEVSWEVHNGRGWKRIEGSSLCHYHNWIFYSGYTKSFSCYWSIVLYRVLGTFSEGHNNSYIEVEYCSLVEMFILVKLHVGYPLYDITSSGLIPKLLRRQSQHHHISLLVFRHGSHQA